MEEPSESSFGYGKNPKCLPKVSISDISSSVSNKLYVLEYAPLSTSPSQRADEIESYTTKIDKLTKDQDCRGLLALETEVSAKALRVVKQKWTKALEQVGGILPEVSLGEVKYIYGLKNSHISLNPWGGATKISIGDTVVEFGSDPEQAQFNRLDEAEIYLKIAKEASRLLGDGKFQVVRGEGNFSDSIFLRDQNGESYPIVQGRLFSPMAKLPQEALDSRKASDLRQSELLEEFKDLAEKLDSSLGTKESLKLFGQSSDHLPPREAVINSLYIYENKLPGEARLARLLSSFESHYRNCQDAMVQAYQVYNEPLQVVFPLDSTSEIMSLTVNEYPKDYRLSFARNIVQNNKAKDFSIRPKVSFRMMGDETFDQYESYVSRKNLIVDTITSNAGMTVGLKKELSNLFLNSAHWISHFPSDPAASPQHSFVSMAGEVVPILDLETETVNRDKYKAFLETKLLSGEFSELSQAILKHSNLKATASFVYLLGSDLREHYNTVEYLKDVYGIELDFLTPYFRHTGQTIGDGISKSLPKLLEAIELLPPVLYKNLDIRMFSFMASRGDFEGKHRSDLPIFIASGSNSIKRNFFHEISHRLDHMAGNYDNNRDWAIAAHGENFLEHYGEQAKVSLGEEIVPGLKRPVGFGTFYAKNGDPNKHEESLEQTVLSIIEEDQASAGEILLAFPKRSAEVVQRGGLAEQPLGIKMDQKKVLLKEYSDGLVDEKFWEDYSSGVKINLEYWKTRIAEQE